MVLGDNSTTRVETILREAAAGEGENGVVLVRVQKQYVIHRACFWRTLRCFAACMESTAGLSAFVGLEGRNIRPKPSSYMVSRCISVQ